MILFNSDEIIHIGEKVESPTASVSVDVRGRLIAPGLVDLHSDAVEKTIEVRPGINFDLEFSLQTLDRRVISCGITTFCHAISFADNELGLRSCEEAEKLVRFIHNFTRSSKSSARHLLHARYEVGSPRAAATIEGLLEEKLLHMVSLMDHTPGQGQFKTTDSYVDYYTRTYKFSPEQVSDLIDHKRALAKASKQEIARLAAKVRRSRLPLLSHDDDSREQVALARDLGATACEFPVSMEAAEKAQEESMKVFMGAPNLIRGCSSNGHLKATETIRRGVCDGLMSDYYPECLTQAPFVAIRELSLDLETAFAMVTSQPGDYLEENGSFGRLVIGGPADLIVMDTSGIWARVTQTWVGGRCVYRADS
jgi:alpha-D-ribose 1-methylphosphonate 5-triphosphate diphosphatase